MFDISFSELLIIAIVALLVIGPEKLPKLARTLGAFTGRMQRYVAQVKDEVNREMRFEELQKLQQEVQAQASQLQSGLDAQIMQVQNSLQTASPAAPSEANVEDFALTPPPAKSRKLSQFDQQPPKPEATPLVSDVALKKNTAKKSTKKVEKISTKSSKSITSKPS